MRVQHVYTRSRNLHVLCVTYWRSRVVTCFDVRYTASFLSDYTFIYASHRLLILNTTHTLPQYNQLVLVGTCVVRAINLMEPVLQYTCLGCVPVFSNNNNNCWCIDTSPV